VQTRGGQAQNMSLSQKIGVSRSKKIGGRSQKKRDFFSLLKNPCRSKKTAVNELVQEHIN
jgi:hypothetical protein